MLKELKAELDSIIERDPAAKNRIEVFLLYPGFKAIRAYRKAHRHYLKGHFFRARAISHRALKKTGREIHPVIGETTEIGDNCTIYQGVTLGGTGKETGKRHPTLGSNVMVGAGARVLGPFKVGNNSKIAANAVVLSEVPPDCTAVGVPARIVKRDGIRVGDLDQIHFPDPVSQEMCGIKRELDKILEGIENTES